MLRPAYGRLREMPCSGFAQEFGRGRITHQLGDFETELSLAAMIASVVHAFRLPALMTNNRQICV